MVLLGLLAFLSPGCGGKSPPLRLVSFAQEGRKDVRLNERIVLRFSLPLDRTSLSDASVRLRGGGGPAAGRWRVWGRELSFSPRLPLRPDCADTGLRPGVEYTLLLRGFPSYRALRALSGRRLERTVRLRFRTKGGDGGEAVPGVEQFVDPVPGTGPELAAVGGVSMAELGAEGVKVAPGSSLRLTFSEPLYPPSLEGGRAKLYVVNAEGTVDPDLDVLPLEARLVRVPPEGCVVAVKPRGGFRAGKRYKLCLEDLGFTDFGGRPLERTRSYLDISCTAPPSS